MRKMQRTKDFEYYIDEHMYNCRSRKLRSKTMQSYEQTLINAIEVAWDRGDLDTLQRFFGYTVSNTKGKPTNSVVIALLADNR